MSKEKYSSSKKVSHQSSPEDIIQLILQDHRPLKHLTKIMKSKDANYSEKQAAFLTFVPALLAHTKPEEQTWYMRMKNSDLVQDGLEGDIEHRLADQLCDELKRTFDKDMFEAKVKVLAELVEQHLREEEEDRLPAFKREASIEERVELGLAYLAFQSEFEAEGSVDSTKEDAATIKKQEPFHHGPM